MLSILGLLGAGWLFWFFSTTRHENYLKKLDAKRELQRQALFKANQ